MQKVSLYNDSKGYKITFKKSTNLVYILFTLINYFCKTSLVSYMSYIYVNSTFNVFKIINKLNSFSSTILTK